MVDSLQDEDHAKYGSKQLGLDPGLSGLTCRLEGLIFNGLLPNGFDHMTTPNRNGL